MLGRWLQYGTFLTSYVHFVQTGEHLDIACISTIEKKVEKKVSPPISPFLAPPPSEHLGLFRREQ